MRRPELHGRPSGYGPDELLLLHGAVRALGAGHPELNDMTQL